MTIIYIDLEQFKYNDQISEDSNDQYNNDVVIILDDELDDDICCPIENSLRKL